MEPYKQRVIDEHAELNIKLDKLVAFLESPKGLSLEREQLFLLTLQKNAMQQYLDILAVRICKF